MQGSSALEEATSLADACEACARELESAPTDEMLYIRFRRAVEQYAEQLRQSGRGLDAASLPGAPGLLGVPATIDLDLRFLGVAALRALAQRSQSTSGGAESESGASPERERLELQRAVMRSRTANTGYMASAPPAQPLQLFFEVHLSAGKSHGSQRRMALFDFEQQELAFFVKEECVRTVSFGALEIDESARRGQVTACPRTFDRGLPAQMIALSASRVPRFSRPNDCRHATQVVSMCLNGEAASVRLSTPAEASAFHTWAMRAVMLDECIRDGVAPPSRPDGSVGGWLLSGTVEKEGTIE